MDEINGNQQYRFRGKSIRKLSAKSYLDLLEIRFWMEKVK